MPHPLMRSGSVEVLDRGVECPVELLLIQDEQVIETLTTHASEKPFTDGIRSRGLIRCCEHPDSTRLRNPSEAHPKRAIVIPKKIFRPLAKRRGFLQLLRYPGVARRSCDAHMGHFARVQLDDEAGEKRAEKQVGDWKEVHATEYLAFR